MDSRLIAAGAIVKVHGLQGEIIVNPLISRPEALEIIPLFLLEDSGGARTPARVEKAKVISKSGRFSFFVKFDRIDSREEALRFVGGRLLLDPVAAKKYLPKEEASWDDVTGFSVSDSENGFTGTVLEVLSGGSQPLLHVKSAGRMLLVPAVDAYVKSVNVRRRELQLQNTAMLLEI